MKRTLLIGAFFALVCSIACGSGESRNARASRFTGASQNDGAGSALVGAWGAMTQGGIFEIVFYSDGRTASNIFGIATYEIGKGVINLSDGNNRLSVPYGLQGAALTLRPPAGDVTLGRLSDDMQRRATGRYCGSLQSRLDDSYQTVIEFDGRGVYTMNGIQSLYWIDAQGVHLIYTLDGFWAQMMFPNAYLDANRIISNFSGGEGDFARCR